MEHAVPFARHFAKLVALLVYERSAVDEQKLQLRAGGSLLKAGPVTLTVSGGALLADGDDVSSVFSGVRECIVQLEGHRVHTVTVSAEAHAADLLAVTRALASPFGRGTADTLGALLAAGTAPSVQVERHEPEPERLETITAAFVMDAVAITEPVALEVEASPVHDPSAGDTAPVDRLELEPAHGAPVGDHAPHTDESSALPPLDIVSVRAMSALTPPLSHAPVAEEGAREAEAPATASVAPEATAPGEPAAPPRRQSSTTPSAMPSTAADAVSLFRMLAGGRRPGESLPDLVQALETTTDPLVVSRVLDDLCTLAEVSLREGHPGEALACFHGIVLQEGSAELADVKRAYILAVRRLAKPAMLATVTGLIGRQPELRATAIEVLQRTGEEGATAVVEQYAAARTVHDQTTLATILRSLTATPVAVAHVLNGNRPLLARTAADLVATLQLADAEPALLTALGHDDLRVRRAVVAALAGLGGPRTSDALVRALQDEAPEVRMQAGFALAALRPPNVVSLLGDALGDEQETEVQVALVQAIGRVGTSEAVERLAQAAEPSRGLFRRKPVQLRVAAVHAIAALRVPGVSAALAGLAEDKERAVRDALAQGTRIHGRRTTRSMAVVKE